MKACWFLEVELNYHVISKLVGPLTFLIIMHFDKMHLKRHLASTFWQEEDKPLLKKHRWPRYSWHYFACDRSPIFSIMDFYCQNWGNSLSVKFMTLMDTHFTWMCQNREEEEESISAITFSVANFGFNFCSQILMVINFWTHKMTLFWKKKTLSKIW